MRYDRSIAIGTRHEALLELIHSGSYSCPKLAEELAVSLPTVSRDIVILAASGIRNRVRQAAYRLGVPADGYARFATTFPKRTMSTANAASWHRDFGIENGAYQPVAKVADPAWPRRDRARTLNGHGDGQETGGAPSVADVGGHGGPSDE